MLSTWVSIAAAGLLLGVSFAIECYTVWSDAYLIIPAEVEEWKRVERTFKRIMHIHNIEVLPNGTHQDNGDEVVEYGPPGTYMEWEKQAVFRVDNYMDIFGNATAILKNEYHEIQCEDAGGKTYRLTLLHRQSSENGNFWELKRTYGWLQPIVRSGVTPIFVAPCLPLLPLYAMSPAAIGPFLGVARMCRDIAVCLIMLVMLLIFFVLGFDMSRFIR